MVESSCMSSLLCHCLDVINVGYDPTMYLTSESQGMVELTIVLFPLEPAPRPFNLTISTVDDTAGKQE